MWFIALLIALFIYDWIGDLLLAKPQKDPLAYYGPDNVNEKHATMVESLRQRLGATL